jgi:hypothetical protein
MPVAPKLVMLALHTRQQKQIENSISRMIPIAGTYDEQDDQAKARKNATRRHVGPCHTYNCHGLTFGARRTGIVGAIEDILKQDEYVIVKPENVLAGDVVIWVNL